MSRIASLATRFRHCIPGSKREERSFVCYSTHFNVPVKFHEGEWYTNERIIELAFVHRHIDLDGIGRRVLDFGCARSELALRLASLGYHVVGVDLREYHLEHPRLVFHRLNLLDLVDSDGFDCIVSISTLEHVGLGAYGEQELPGELGAVATKLVKLLKPGAKLIITVPFGQEYQDSFLRSFTYDDVSRLFSPDHLLLMEERYYFREDFKFWHPCDRTVAERISNSAADRGHTGVNCVACFVWQRLAEESRS